MKTKSPGIQHIIALRTGSSAVVTTLSGILLTLGLTLGSIFGTIGSLRAQDPGFSQFFASPLSLNPALTGKFNGVLRVAGNYRNQWPTISNAFITSTISVDAPILRNKLPENDTWGLGVMAMTDKTAGGILNSNYFSLSTAYHKALDEDGYNTIGIGFQGTYANRSLNGTQLHFEDQLDLNGAWDLPSSESISNRYVTVNYFDMNLGALFNGSSGNNNYYFGASAYHLNHPKASFMGTDTISVPTRVTAHAGGYFPLTGTTSTIYLSGLYSNQAGAHEMVMGGAWALNTTGDEEDPVNFYAGVWGRFSNVTDAIIPYVGLDYSNFNLGISYDVNVSKLKTASQGVGGIEISLIYIKKPSDGHHGVPCPKF